MKVTIADGKLDLNELTDLVMGFIETCKSKQQDFSLDLRNVHIDVYKHQITIDELTNDIEQA